MTTSLLELLITAKNKNNFLAREVLIHTKGQHMKESDSHAGIVINNILQEQILQSKEKVVA